MRIHINVLMVIGILAVAPLCHAETEKNTSIEEVKKETQDLLQALREYTANQKEEAVENTKEALNKMDKRFDEFEARIDENWDKMDDAARKKARENLKDLRKQRNEVAEWYGSMKTSSADAWEHITKGFSDAYKSIYDAWGKAEKEFDFKK